MERMSTYDLMASELRDARADNQRKDVEIELLREKLAITGGKLMAARLEIAWLREALEKISACEFSLLECGVNDAIRVARAALKGTDDA